MKKKDRVVKVHLNAADSFRLDDILEYFKSQSDDPNFTPENMLRYALSELHASVCDESFMQGVRDRLAMDWSAANKTESEDKKPS